MNSGRLARTSATSDKLAVSAFVRFAELNEVVGRTVWNTVDVDRPDVEEE